MMSFFRAYRFVAIPMLLATLVGCSDEVEDTPDKPDAVASEPREMTEREKRQAKRDEVYNPTPEQQAAKAAEAEATRLAFLPHVNELPAKQKADRDEYVDISKPFLPLKIYLTYRTWEESQEQLAEDIRNFGTAQGGYLVPYEPASQELRDALEMARSRGDANAFAKADALKAVEDFALEQARSYDDKRLVKFVIESPEIMAYDLTNKTFSIKHPLLHGMQARVNNPGEYEAMLVNTEGLHSITITDEQEARAIEAARKNLVMTVYGYVSQVTRDQKFGELTGSPDIKVVPHFADIHTKDGEILHTIDL